VRDFLPVLLLVVVVVVVVDDLDAKAELTVGPHIIRFVH
jgi:hypothetical protein